MEAAGLTVSSGFAAVCLAAALVALPEVLGALVVLEVAGAAFLVSAFLGSSAGLVAAGFAVDAGLAVAAGLAAGFAVEELVAFVCAAVLAAGLVVEAVGFAVAAGFTVAAGFAAPLGAAADGAPSAFTVFLGLESFSAIKISLDCFWFVDCCIRFSRYLICILLQYYIIIKQIIALTCALVNLKP